MTDMRRREFNGVLATLASASLGKALAPPNRADSEEGAAERTRSITDVPGVSVGHFTETRRSTGCTAILFDREATAAIDYDGCSPGSYNAVRLRAESPVDRINALFLTGGGSYGLAAAAGLVRYLEENGIGLQTSVSGLRLPSVVGGSIFDLDVGDPKIRPDAESAYRASKVASRQPVEEGNAGAGAGATVGKMLRGFGGMKGGLGSASISLGDVVIGALVIINASGDIVDWRNGKIIAGARNPEGKGFANIVETLKKKGDSPMHAANYVHDPISESTNLVVVATNASFDKRALTKIASMASTGAARAINPYHTMGDGDSSFAVSTNHLKIDFDISAAGTLAAEVVSEAVLRAVKMAKSIEGWPAWRDYSVG